MTVVLKYNFNASFNQGPSETIKEEMLMNTYDVVSIKLDSGQTKVIDILPPPTDSDPKGINFFCITSDQYGEEGNTNSSHMISYRIEPSTNTPVDIILDRPHVLIGKSVLNQIGKFSKLTINNQTVSETNVRILVGRDV